MNLISKTCVVVSLSMTAILSTNVFAGDIAAGKSKAATCVACHGANGISQIPMYPNLAGQKEQYLSIQLKAFRSGERKNMIMAPMVAGLSDTDIDNLAAYFSSLDPSGK
ncbi:cytochrome c [Paraglaciecola sp. L1A13]|uniref:c-type cytochrome n=1 Tax=Paraglaciecola sp. L1A13 TaxID=2686359 RepID=UPI00131E615E|nr:cytochrome c [Paraglaciecola sp. L1A13]